MLNKLAHAGNVATWECKSACTNDVSPLNQNPESAAAWYTCQFPVVVEVLLQLHGKNFWYNW